LPILVQPRHRGAVSQARGGGHDAEGAADALALGLPALFAKWRTSKSHTCKAPKITSGEPIAAILDRERVELGTKVQVKFIQTAFKTLVPNSSSTAID
jgi:hypothetical protein